MGMTANRERWRSCYFLSNEIDLKKGICIVRLSSPCVAYAAFPSFFPPPPHSRSTLCAPCNFILSSVMRNSEARLCQSMSLALLCNAGQ